MKRSTEPMKRYKALGPGKKTKAKQDAIQQATDDFFGLDGPSKNGWLCQISRLSISPGYFDPHHKTPRSELRKAGIKDLDSPKYLLMLHPLVHLYFVHSGNYGRPKDPVRAALFKAIEDSPVNAETGGFVELSPQHKLDLERFMKEHGL